MTDEERVYPASVRSEDFGVWSGGYEEERRLFLTWLEAESKIPSENQAGLSRVKQYLDTYLYQD